MSFMQLCSAHLQKGQGQRSSHTSGRSTRPAAASWPCTGPMPSAGRSCSWGSACPRMKVLHVQDMHTSDMLK